ncbi:MAG: type II toxin-antitoxin system VapC family toxin [Magnetococcales bacterium]|nr:type II toxin-antitoxin system VapC family toxin [Magnetococcales bacterium]
MQRFVLDASVTLSWCFSNQQTDYTQEVLRSLHHAEALVPSIWILEVSNVLLVAERRNMLLPTASSRFISLLDSLPIVEIASRRDAITSSIMNLARTNNLTSYDATYLELAIREGIPIATLDKPLHRAAEQIGVGVFFPVKNLRDQ